MADDTTVTESDQGKVVKNADGETVGRVIEVKNNGAYVEPDPDLTDTIRSKLGWGGSDEEDTYRLDSSHIDTVTGDEIRLDR